ncbi:hypothetical protein AX769_00155 [Frondihabitans sp. PAMC 28766]|nr:hypothetical protein AX769_00155 [Frondihabitans sp. PAMC 28766]
MILRNVIHRRLSATSPKGEWWLDQTLRLDARAQADVAKALSRATRHGQSTAGRLVAELSFGFWRHLLANTYSSTVWPRIHHEPILRTDIARALDDIDHLASALAPGSIGTVIDVARVMALAGRRP